MAVTDQILAVVFVLGLLAGVLWLARRRSGLPLIGRPRRSGGEAALTVVGRLPLTPHHSLHLVRVGGRTILVGTHPAGVVFGPAETFQDALRQAGNGGDAR